MWINDPGVVLSTLNVGEGIHLIRKYITTKIFSSVNSYLVDIYNSFTLFTVFGATRTRFA